MSGRRDRDQGSIMVLVLVLMVLGSLVIVPTIVYTTTVLRAGSVQVDKSRSVQLSRGGTWVALTDSAGLYDDCGVTPILSSIEDVTITCQVLADERLRKPEDVPYHVAGVQADTALPPAFVSGNEYPSPNNTAVPGDYDAWLDPNPDVDWTIDSTEDKVWLPQLPVQATSSAGNRDTQLSFDPTCRIFFPGTFDTPITIDGPTYFTSGVYYFTEPITLENGADVVVGNGLEAGCTDDFEAIALANSVPDPLNMSGLGGTMVLGGNARIIVDDSGSGDIRFAINQRYVATGETSVAASSSVSIVSVNGTHEPLQPLETLGDDLDVDGVIKVPASTVGTDGDPLAAQSDYEPSIHTSKPEAPDAPTNVQIEDWQLQYVYPNDSVADGMLTVTWDVPDENGSIITEYVATESFSGNTCSATIPLLPETILQPSCTIFGIPHMSSTQRTSVTVEAKNDYGWSDPSDPSAEVRVDLRGNAPHKQEEEIGLPTEPQNVAVGAAYSDGLEIVWDPPVDTGGSAITHYHVTAVDTVTSAVLYCDGWWDETSCILQTSDGLTDGASYDVTVEAVVEWGGSEYPGAPAQIDFDLTDNALPVPPNIEPDPVVFTLGTSPQPIEVPIYPGPRVPEPILDFSTVGSDTVDISIAGYIAVPQGHIHLDTVDPTSKSLSLVGGVVAAQFRVDTGVLPASIDVEFDNPIAQKRIKIRSEYDGDYEAVSETVVQVNRSGSIGINSWVVR
ncbi:MAG: fibronectin type III domain-containing protein [Ilumatobacter sp.]|uniref:fibronectin type III domain-containing protein n=1 Tax=Ilumatobacter sp. TaxID=1967498 RepID=UPI00261A6038|nr:fibronectin type III domain-containing protein [Ilumatobacter sp.]MDJ0770253.1 fibronectin type III domain-containing protein [Ilumatobacter sp.]